MTAILDKSNGWNDIAEEFMRLRSDSGASVVRDWVNALSPNPSILDIGCGHGWPLTPVLLKADASISAIDASPNMVRAYANNFPEIPVVCEAVDESRFFDRKFNGILCVGLMFLLPEAEQCQLIQRVPDHLQPEGQFLFSAPCQICEWQDLQTGRRSRSLGVAAYTDHLEQAGLRVIGDVEDEGGSFYLMAQMR